MSLTRAPFDPAGPFSVSVPVLHHGPHRLKRGDALPREGMSDYDLLLLWQANQIDVEPNIAMLSEHAATGETPLLSADEVRASLTAGTLKIETIEGRELERSDDSEPGAVIDSLGLEPQKPNKRKRR